MYVGRSRPLRESGILWRCVVTHINPGSPTPRWDRITVDILFFHVPRYKLNPGTKRIGISPDQLLGSLASPSSDCSPGTAVCPGQAGIETLYGNRENFSAPFRAITSAEFKSCVLDEGIVTTTKKSGPAGKEHLSKAFRHAPCGPCLEQDENEDELAAGPVKALSKTHTLEPRRARAPRHAVVKLRHERLRSSVREDTSKPFVIPQRQIDTSLLESLLDSALLLCLSPSKSARRRAPLKTDRRPENAGWLR